MDTEETTQQARGRPRNQDQGPRWVTIKVRAETKRLLDLISVVEGISLVDLEDEMARERWQKVKASDLLP